MIGQTQQQRIREQTNLIMSRFLAVLPSNYVSTVTGPFYTLQFQAAAEQLAAFLVTAEDVFQSTNYQFTQTDFLWEVIGALVFPNAKQPPVLSTDDAYRTFLRKMVILLLKGSRKEPIESALKLLTDNEVAIIERYIQSPDQPFTFDVFVTGFPETDPFAFTENVKQVLVALKPAHTLYQFQFLFTEAFGELFADSMSWEMEVEHYEDFRSYWNGTKAITSSSGETLSGRYLFRDTQRDFIQVPVNSLLTIHSGENAGSYRVTQVLGFPVYSDDTPRAYSTSPTGLTGTCTVSEGVLITDAGQDFTQIVEGEILTLSSGPNAGAYRLARVIGTTGGCLAGAQADVGVATQAVVAKTLLRTDRRMPAVGGGQSYSVGVDRLGMRVPHTVVAEDVSMQFWR